VFVRDGASRIEVADLLTALGYSGEDSAIRVGLAAAPGTDTVVLFDLPASREELREAAGSAKRTIALIQPRQLGSLGAPPPAGRSSPSRSPNRERRPAPATRRCATSFDRCSTPDSSAGSFSRSNRCSMLRRRHEIGAAAL
jgi:hypothetical protein